MLGIVNDCVGNTPIRLHIEMYYQSMCIYSPDILLLLRSLPAFASRAVSDCCFLLLWLDTLAAPPQSQPEWNRPHNSSLSLERWYQDIMSSGDAPQPCPPPLPAKSHSSRRQGQVNTVAPRPLAGSVLLLHSAFVTFSLLLDALCLWVECVIGFCRCSRCSGPNRMVKSDRHHRALTSTERGPRHSPMGSRWDEAHPPR